MPGGAARWPAAKIAGQMIDTLRDETGRLPLPVDPVVVARSLGINVYTSSLGPSVSGIIVKQNPSEEPDIFLNDDHAPVRQRFTCAHELGHYFGNFTWNGERKRTYTHKRDALSSCGTDIEEMYANAFAANLLMPESEVKNHRQQGFSTVELSRLFWVSVEAMKNRLGNLGIGEG